MGFKMKLIMENWRNYLQEEQFDLEVLLESEQLDEGFKSWLRNAALAAIMGGAALGAPGMAMAAPSAGDASLPQSAQELGLDKASAAHHTIIAEKIADAIMAAIKADKVKLDTAAQMDKEEFKKVFMKLTDQTFNNLGRFSKLEDITAAAEKVVSLSNDLNPNSLTNKVKKASK